MLQFLVVIIRIFLIIIIFFRTPKESIGLTSFANKSDVLGSPSSAQRYLNFMTALGIIIYLGLAIQLNLVKNT